MKRQLPHYLRHDWQLAWGLLSITGSFVFLLAFELASPVCANDALDPSHFVPQLTHSSLEQNSESLSLKTGKPIERDLAGAESHSYRVSLATGQALLISVEQQGIDLALTLKGPDGSVQTQADSPNGSWGPEELFFVADKGGEYQLEIKSFDADASRGRYRVAIRSLRPATAQDRRRFKGYQLQAQGDELRAKNSADDLRTALRKYEEALQIQRDANDERGQAITLYDIGVAHQLLTNLRQAIPFYERSLPLWRRVGDSNAEAATLSNLGLAFDDLGDAQKAIDVFDRAVALFRTAGDKKEEANTLNNIGRLYAKQSQYSKALDYLNRALPVFRSTGNKREAQVLANIGVIYGEMGEYQKAIDINAQTLPLLRTAGDRKAEGFALITTGDLKFLLGEYRQALDSYTQALTLLKNVGDRYGEAQALNNIGKMHISLGERRQARDFFEKALAVAEAAKDHFREAYIRNNLGSIYLEDGDRSKALSQFEQSLALLRAQGNRHGEAQTLNNLGMAYLLASERQKALEYFTRALAIDRETGEKAEEGNTLGNLMLGWKASGRSPLAIFYGKQAVNTFQEIRTKIQKLDKELQTSFLNSKEKVYRELADILISEGRLSEAQQVLRLLKEEEYFEFIRRDKKESSNLTGRADLTRKEAEWERRHREFTGKLIILAKERSELLAKKSRTPEEERRLLQLDSDLSIARQDFQRFLDELINESGKSEIARERGFQLKESEGLMEDLRELGKGVVALYTVMGEEKYRVILVTPDIQKGYEYPIKSSDLNHKIAAFREALEDPDADPLPAAQELYRILVGPLAKDLNDLHAETLMWSLDGVLRYVPVAALHDGKKYLIESYRNVVFTPASMARLKDVSSLKWKGLGLGVSKAHGDFEALPAVPGELHAIIREGSLSRNREGVLLGKVMLDDAFTERGMRLSLRQRYPLVHIASHFQFSPVDESDSFLLLGDGGHFSIEQIKDSVNLFSGVELLTLSACHTAMGGEGSDGKEVEGFGMLAQRKGAKAVIASLWSVADRSTQTLMREFYQLRESHPGMTKAEALRQAQLILLRGRVLEASQRTVKTPRGLGLVKNAANTAPYSHPFYWAPFILIGNWR